ncbi:MAG: hypothetical protein R2699_06225 [Acidimicrobiales bacterium]|nr:hypothetical protein [Acidimicrobiales bacterium]MCB1248632.1 hypothetical protein [Acidimicrobiales bacterium]MCB1262083.1 hypothetical protein [Acidimicrobiales bacterium]
MGCILALLATVAPRFVIFLLWVFSDRLSVAFSSFILGFLGFLLLPYTTVFYAFAYEPIRGVSGFGWFIVLLGFFIDMSSWFGNAKQGNDYRTRSV